MSALRSLLAERLTEAAEDILTDFKTDMSPDEQRAALRERLSAVADEIFLLLEGVMGEEVSGDGQRLGIALKIEARSSHRADEWPVSEQSRTSIQVGKSPPHTKDASTETDCEFVYGKREEKGTSGMMEAETLPLSGSRIFSLNNSEAASEEDDDDGNVDVKEDECCRLCGQSLPKSVAGKKIKKLGRKTSTSNKTTSCCCCRVCGKFFRYRRSFLKHILTHQQTSDLCGACGKRLDPDESLKVHLQTHNEENSCRDQTEDKPSSDAESRESEEDWRDSEGSENDDSDTKDGQKLRTKANKPKSLNKESSYSCKVCGKSFCYRASFLKHVQEDEAEGDLCGVCGKRFDSEDGLKLHLQTYVRTNDCEVCSKHFDSHKQLEMHMRTHTGEKPFVCSVCGKAFAQNGNLMGHMRVHTGEKPFVCSVCGQSFSFKEYMTAHMRIHTGEKPFLCSVCGKGFRQRGTLKTHMMIHTGDSTHRCSVCDKKFYKSGALKIHMRSHTGEKPYLCNVCGKSFTAGGSLTKHMAIHDGEKTLGCSVCGKEFERKEDLKRHAQTHKDQATLTSL